ncbi:divalent-cation tolerance protein CutA [Patescibacteria group bacterium]|nr:divalent-cation tolerance protein CutA [Patescibacteria group bacterium]
MVLIYITCRDKKEARKIASYLIKRRLTACCDIFPIDSIYWWNNKIVKDKEMVLILKTLKKNFTIIEREVKKLHSYNTPCILEISVSKVSSKYLRWLNKEL